MAVPKKKQGRSRTRKRRAQHTAARPRLNECPRCHSPRLPHRVCPTCGTYDGREVISFTEPERSEPQTVPTEE
jgi:large subunit ribosomal protein L32